MYNVRYHIASIVGIFLALAIGLLLGAAIGGSENMREISDDLITNLRSDYESSLTKNSQLSAQVDEQQKFLSEFVSAWMVGRLKDKHLIILADHDNTAGIDRVRDVVERAGAKVTVVKIDSNALSALDEARYAKIIQDAGLTNETAVDARERSQTLAQLLSYEWLLTQNKDSNVQQQRQRSGILDLLLGKRQKVHQQPHVMASLVDAHIINTTTSPEELAKGFDGVINMAVSTGSTPSPFALELCGQLSTYQVPVVLTQIAPFDAPLLKEAQAHGFSGMGGAATMRGAYGIVALLSGAEKGVYGLSGLAAYPPLPNNSSFAGAGTSEAQAVKDTIEAPVSPSDTAQGAAEESSDASASSSHADQQAGGDR